jgi:hypothetical protein
MALFPLYYAGNIAYYQALASAPEITFEVKEHFVKQSYRSRMEIMSPTGLHKLSIPVLKNRTSKSMDQLNISYSEDWQKNHWKGLEAAYRRSPYFEYYEHHFHSFYKEKTERLVDYNLRFHETICALLKINLSHSLSSEYLAKKDVEHDFRGIRFELKQPTKYIQVFADRQAFLPNMSILDALFNLGPQTANLLR